MRWFEISCDCCGQSKWEQVLGTFRDDENGSRYVTYKCQVLVPRWDEHFGEYEQPCEGTLEVREDLT